nr:MULTISPECIES: hypothetical protein [unclassified Helicobacter]
MLDFLEKNKEWLFDINFVCKYLRSDNTQAVKIDLSRFCKAGLIERVAKGLYGNPRTNERGVFHLEKIATYLRPKTTFYLSLEYLLSEEGLISQIPNRLTFITSGRSQTFFTKYGILEYTHTSRDKHTLLDNCYFDKVKGLWVATTEQAIDDIYRHNRAVDLYEEQQAKDRGEYGY